MAPSSDKFKSPIRPLELRRSANQCSEVKAVAAEGWLGSLSLAPGTKAKLRNIMSAFFNHAIRHEWPDKNPISFVRQSAKREYIPAVLDAAEIGALLTELLSTKREAQTKVVRMILPDRTQTTVAGGGK